MDNGLRVRALLFTHLGIKIRALRESMERDNENLHRNAGY
jgi:hypothetical protein